MDFSSHMSGYGTINYADGAAKGYYDYTGTFLNNKFHGIGS